MDKMGAGGIITFVALAIGLIILAPIVLKISNEVLGGFSNALNDTSQEAATRVDYVHNTFVGFWDWIIAIAFFVNVIMLFVFAFLVDTHPFFALFYFISAVITLMFSNSILAPAQVIFGTSSLSTEILQLPIIGFVVNTFNLILLGIIVLTGIIMYGKFRVGGGLQR